MYMHFVWTMIIYGSVLIPVSYTHLTEKNLLTSFAGESQARMRYTYFASTAKKEGYEQIAAIDVYKRQIFIYLFP